MRLDEMGAAPLLVLTLVGIGLIALGRAIGFNSPGWASRTLMEQKL